MQNFLSPKYQPSAFFDNRCHVSVGRTEHTFREENWIDALEVHSAMTRPRNTSGMVIIALPYVGKAEISFEDDSLFG